MTNDERARLWLIQQADLRLEGGTEYVKLRHAIGALLAAVQAKGEADARNISSWVRDCEHESRGDPCEWRSALNEARGCVQAHAADMPEPPR